MGIIRVELVGTRFSNNIKKFDNFENEAVLGSEFRG